MITYYIIRNTARKEPTYLQRFENRKPRWSPKVKAQRFTLEAIPRLLRARAVLLPLRILKIERIEE